MTTNNKSESGDSLRKQEENCDCWRTGDKCDNCPKVATSECCGKPLMKSMICDCDNPGSENCGTTRCSECRKEVAPSEKEETFEERTARKLDEDILSQFTTFKIKTEGVGYGTVKITPTPHESEDLSEEIRDIFNDWLGNRKDTFDSEGKLKADIGELISKAYQRGREEGLLEGYNRDDKNLIPKLKADLLSLAVQEIEKEKYVARGHTYASGFNSGLDKAKSIISGVMKK